MTITIPSINIEKAIDVFLGICVVAPIVFKWFTICLYKCDFDNAARYLKTHFKFIKLILIMFIPISIARFMYCFVMFIKDQSDYGNIIGGAVCAFGMIALGGWFMIMLFNE